MPKSPAAEKRTEAPTLAVPKKLEKALALVKGTRVELKEFGASVTVFPIGPRQLHIFAAQVGGAVSLIAKTCLKIGSDPGLEYLSQMIPYVMFNMMECLESCVTVEPAEISFEQIPHWELPKIIEAWLRINFDSEKKWLPWLAVVETIVEEAVGKKILISEKVLQALSEAASGSKTSSTASAPGGPMPDGVPPKSDIGPTK